MEFTIKKIVSIDKDAENFRKNMDLKLINEKKQLELCLDEMREDSEGYIEEKRKEIFENKLKDANIIAESIEKEKIIEIEKIRVNFKGVKNNIIDDAMRIILK